MSYVIAAPDVMAAATTDLANIGSEIRATDGNSGTVSGSEPGTGDTGGAACAGGQVIGIGTGGDGGTGGAGGNSPTGHGGDGADGGDCGGPGLIGTGGHGGPGGNGGTGPARDGTTGQPGQSG